MKKYYIITYGCQMNKSDSERIAAVLEKSGFKPASKKNEADLILVNMCSVRQSAVDRVHGNIQEFMKLKSRNRELKTVLTGCVLEKNKNKFKNNFDLILNIKDLPELPQKLSIKRSKNIVFQYKDYLNIKPKYQNNFSVFIPISSGCGNFCAYCAVPFARGNLICRNYKEILKEIKSAVKKGYKEIWLLGQNVNNYKSEIQNPKSETNSKFKIPNSKKINFAKLLKMVNDIPGDFWIRFTSPHPRDFSDELIETMAKCGKVTPYLNLPLQSGDDEILKKMKRPYTVQYYKKLVEKIRKSFKKFRKKPEGEICLSTDVIVGFPTETKKQFENTANIFKKIKFDMAYISRYSPRPQTAAAKLEDDVSRKEKEKRWKILSDILKKTSLENNKKYIGRTTEVLTDKTKNGFLSGKTRTYKTVKILAPDAYRDLIGRFIKVKIIKATSWGLEGKFIEA